MNDKATFEKIENGPLFPVGQLVSTQGIAAQVLKGFNFVPYLERHLKGDWGDMCADDKRANDIALKTGGRLFSAYKTMIGKIWIITEWDRSVTTILYPDEY